MCKKTFTHAFLHANALFYDTAVKIRLALMKTPLWLKSLGNTKSINLGTSNCQKMWQFVH